MVKNLAVKIPLLMMIVASVASADFIQNPDQVNGLFSDGNGLFAQQSIADDFVLTSDESLGELNWWGGYFNTNDSTTPDAFTILIHGDSGGSPDSSGAFFSQSGIAPTRVDTGIDLFGVDEFQYTFDFGGLNLSAGTYWLEIFNDTSATADNWFWETGTLDPNGTPLGAFSTDGLPGVTWNPTGFDQSFTISTSSVVPEPSSALAIAIVGCVAATRRRK